VISKTGGAFLTTGGFDSFQALGNTVQLSLDRLFQATDRLWNRSLASPVNAGVSRRFVARVVHRMVPGE
jgi:hypothetical protein